MGTQCFIAASKPAQRDALPHPTRNGLNKEYLLFIESLNFFHSPPKNVAEIPTKECLPITYKDR